MSTEAQRWAWRGLSAFESADLVRRNHERTFERRMNAGAAQDVISAIAQGREYFNAAATAGELVKPLLLYYGVLSLSNALNVFARPQVRASTLKPGHGLKSSRWPEMLAEDGGTVRLQIEVSVGAFSQLMDVSRERYTISVSTTDFDYDFGGAFSGGVPPSIGFFGQELIVQRPAGAGLGARLSLKGLLGRIPEISEVYQECFDEPPKNFPVSVVRSQRNNELVISVRCGSAGFPGDDVLRREYALQDGAGISRPALGVVRDVYASRYESLVDDRMIELRYPAAISYAIPFIEDGVMIAPFEDGSYVPALPRLFALSYFLGMLSRYHSTAWLSLVQGRGNGNIMLPIVRESVAAIEGQFPVLVLRELTRARI